MKKVRTPRETRSVTIVAATQQELVLGTRDELDDLLALLLGLMVS